MQQSRSLVVVDVIFLLFRSGTSFLVTGRQSVEQRINRIVVLTQSIYALCNFQRNARPVSARVYGEHSCKSARCSDPAGMLVVLILPSTSRHRPHWTTSNNNVNNRSSNNNKSNSKQHELKPHNQNPQASAMSTGCQTKIQHPHGCWNPTPMGWISAPTRWC